MNKKQHAEILVEYARLLTPADCNPIVIELKSKTFIGIPVKDIQEQMKVVKDRGDEPYPLSDLEVEGLVATLEGQV